MEHDNIQDTLQWVIKRGDFGLLLTLKVSNNYTFKRHISRRVGIHL